jgi:aspartate-semialdehyde dehydrogenase
VSDGRATCAVLGAGGYIGQHFVRLLADHPQFAAPLLVGGPRSQGRALGELWQLAEPPPADLAGTKLIRRSPAALARLGVQVVFGALPSGTAGAAETELARRGLDVFTNAADHRMDETVPLLVPEVNAPHLRALASRRRTRGLLVANPNCSATGLALALRPVWSRLRPRSVHVSTYQALSGAGYPGVPSLAITDNVVPFIAHEEEKMAAETGKLLGVAGRDGRIRPAGVPVLAQCARVGVREGHLEAVTVEARGRPSRAELLEAWRGFDPLADRFLPTAPYPPIDLRAEVDRPQPLRDRWAGTPARARGMAAVVGRVRWEPPWLRFFVLSHNAVRGGAGGSVLNAELAHSEGLLGSGSPRGGGR